MAADLGERARVRGAQSRHRRGSRPSQELRPRATPVPVRDPAYGPHARVHDRRRRHPLSRAERDARSPPAGLRLLRLARRKRGDPRGRPPARDHRAQHREHHALDAACRVGVRLDTVALDPRPRVPALAAVAVPEVPRARARVPEGGAGQVVPGRPDGACQRAGPRRPLRALRERGRVAPHGAVVLPDHGLRAGVARRPRHGRLARVDQGPAAQLDRSLGRRGGHLPDRGAGRGGRGLHDASRHALRRDVLRPRAGARAGRPHRLRRGARVRPSRVGEEDPGAGGRRREDRRLHRPARREPRQR